MLRNANDLDHVRAGANNPFAKLKEKDDKS